MTLEKAIEILSGQALSRTPLGAYDEREAIQLGIEALKQELHVRQLHGNPDNWLLPGETKD